MVAALAGCATSRRDATPTRVRLTTWPETAFVVVDCGARRFTGAAPLDFEFPSGPDVHCVADVVAEYYQPLHVDIDRKFLFDHGELKFRGDVYRAPRPMTAGTINVVEAIILSIDDGIERLVTAGRNAVQAKDPDITVKISLQPESSS